METSAFAQHSTEAQANTGREKRRGGQKSTWFSFVYFGKYKQRARNEK